MNLNNNGQPVSKRAHMNNNNIANATFLGQPFAVAKAIFVNDTWFDGKEDKDPIRSVTSHKEGNNYVVDVVGRADKGTLNADPNTHVDTRHVATLLKNNRNNLEPHHLRDPKVLACVLFTVKGNLGPFRFIQSNRAKIESLGQLSDQDKQFVAHVAWLSSQGSVVNGLYDPLTKQIATALTQPVGNNNKARNTNLATKAAGLTVSLDDIAKNPPSQYYQEFIRIRNSNPPAGIAKGLVDDLSRFNYYWSLITEERAMNQSGGSGITYFLNTISGSRRHSKKAGSNSRHSKKAGSNSRHSKKAGSSRRHSKKAGRR